MVFNYASFRIILPKSYLGVLCYKFTVFVFLNALVAFLHPLSDIKRIHILRFKISRFVVVRLCNMFELGVDNIFTKCRTKESLILWGFCTLKINLNDHTNFFRTEGNSRGK